MASFFVGNPDPERCPVAIGPTGRQCSLLRSYWAELRDQRVQVCDTHRAFLERRGWSVEPLKGRYAFYKRYAGPRKTIWVAAEFGLGETPGWIEVADGRGLVGLLRKVIEASPTGRAIVQTDDPSKNGHES